MKSDRNVMGRTRNDLRGESEEVAISTLSSSLVVEVFIHCVATQGSTTTERPYFKQYFHLYGTRHGNVACEHKSYFVMWIARLWVRRSDDGVGATIAHLTQETRGLWN